MTKEAGQSGRWSLCGWLDDPSPARGLHVLRATGWAFQSYAELARGVNGEGRRLRDAGVRRGDRIAVVGGAPDRFLEGFFGALSCGATVVPLASPTLFGATYVRYVLPLLRASDASVILAPEDMAAPVEVALAESGLRTRLLAGAADGTGAPAGAEPAGTALMQFTSGSTAGPRCVRISREALHAQLAMIREWLDWSPDDAVASWLPLHHDMGLIGAFVTSVVSQTDLWIMSPEKYIRRPVEFLRAIGTHGINISPAPTFGYAYAGRRVTSGELEGTDFSAFRAAVIGAERLDPGALVSFVDVVRPHGFRWEALRPAYGLAEATLAVTGLALGARPRVAEVDWTSLRQDQAVAIRAVRPIDAHRAEHGSALLSSGGPVGATRVRIVDSGGRALPEGCLGEVVVESPSLADGYEGAPREEASTRLENGRLVTGDAGFMVDGELYVVGRMTDCLKVRGRGIYVEQVEESIASAIGVSVHRCAVVPGHDRERDAIVAVVEAPAGDWVDRAVEVLFGLVGSDLDIRVYAARRSGIPLTTSGKKRRRALAEQILVGTAPVELL